MSEASGAEKIKLSWEMSSTFILSKKALALCESRSSAIDLYKLICRDPILFSQTLRLYNYFYPNDGEVYISIAKIMIALNQNTVKNFVLRYANNAASEMEHNIELEEVMKIQRCSWLHSHAAGIASRFTAKLRGIEGEKLEEYYAAGLLHDIKKYFAFKIDEKYVPEITGLNKSLRDVINFHYKTNYLNYYGAFGDLVRTAAFANQFVNVENLARSGSTTQSAYDSRLLGELNIKEPQLKKLKDITAKELKKSCAFAGIKEA